MITLFNMAQSNFSNAKIMRKLKNMTKFCKPLKFYKIDELNVQNIYNF